MAMNLAAVLGSPQNGRIYLLECLHLWCWLLNSGVHSQTHICAMPRALLHGPCQAGQHAPLAAELQGHGVVQAVVGHFRDCASGFVAFM
jgi:hypothetical protein